MENIELEHSGIKGMRWGVRRFQYKDGSLTPEGAKRYGSGDGERRSLGQVIKDRKTAKKRKAALAKARQAKIDKEAHKKAAAEGKLSVKDMTDEELYTAIRRSQMEQQYKALNPEKVSGGKKFADALLNKVIAPAAISAGEQFVRKSLNKFGDNLLKDVAQPDEIATLKKTYEKLDLEKKISDLKNPKEESLDSIVKRLENEKKYKDLTADYNDIERENRNFNARQKHAENEAATAKKNESSQKEEQSSESKRSKKEPEVERYEATGDDIIGEGKSKFTGWDKSSKNTSRSTNDDVIDSVATSERTISDIPSIEVSSGRNYINNLLLEDKSK